MPGVPIRILSGEDEADLSAAGLLCGIPQADGLLADIGGGSLEVVRLTGGQPGPARTLPLGVIRLADRAEGDLVRARALAEADLAGVPWLASAPGRDLYLVGGAWRALARIHIMQTGYPAAHRPPLHDRPGGGAGPHRRHRLRPAPDAGKTARRPTPPPG